MKDARKLDVVLHSATGLKKVSTSKMSVYAVAWIEPSIRVPSPMDKAHGSNPVWNTTMTLSLEERTLGHGMYLNIELLGHGIVTTKRIGFVSVNISDILLAGSKGASVHARFPAHPVTRRSGRQQGSLSFEIHLQESPTLLSIQEMIPKTSPLDADAELTPTMQQESDTKQNFDIKFHQDQDSSSPTSNLEDGIHKSMSRNRIYALRPRSCLSCY